jgi:DNA primase
MSLSEFILECHNNLVKKVDREETIALEYLTKRNLLESSIVTHKIGYCSSSIVLPDSIAYFGQDVSEENKKWNMSSFIRGRIIVPIFSEFNKPVGFATRVPSTLPGNTWWNVPFKKSNHIFLLNKTRKEVFNQNKIYLVEGYMDALILYQNGMKNVGCIMGTALTSRKIGLIARYCNNICLCFDTDKNKAGQNAQKIAIVTLKRFDFCDKLSVIDNLPIGEDPDVFVTKYGMEAFLFNERVLKSTDIKKIFKEIASKNKEFEYV